MALKGNWIDKINGVDENSAEDINQVAHAVIEVEDSVSNINRAAYTSGVFWDPEGTSMNAYVNGAMKVRIDPGVVIIDGVVKKFAATNRTYNTQETDRVNACVVRLDQSTGEIKMHFRECIEQGGLLISVDDNAVLPIRNAKYYDLVICCMRIPGGTTQITSEMVYNMQNEDEYCGYVKSKTYGSSGGSSSRTTIVPKTEINFSETDGYFDLYWVDLTNIATYVPQIETSPTYIVTFNNVVYECVAWNTDAQGLLIGNGAMIQKTTIYDNYKSDVPFVIFIDGDGINVYCNDAGVANIKIEKVN